MSKVAEFINCVIDGLEYKNKAKLEVIDLVITGFFLFMFANLFILMIDYTCIVNNYYSDNCHLMRDVYTLGGLL